MYSSTTGKIIEIRWNGFLLENNTIVETQTHGKNLGLIPGDDVYVSGGSYNGVFASSTVRKIFPDGSTVGIPANSDEINRMRLLSSGTDAGKFEVLFPEIPTHYTSKSEKEHRFYTVCRKRKLFFSGKFFLEVSYEPNFDGSLSLDERLRQTAQLPNVCSPLNSSPITIKRQILLKEDNRWVGSDIQCPGIEVTFEWQENQSVLSIVRRLYDIQYDDVRILYQITVGTERGVNAKKEVNQFFSSFKLN